MALVGEEDQVEGFVVGDECMEKRKGMIAIHDILIHQPMNQQQPTSV